MVEFGLAFLEVAGRIGLESDEACGQSFWRGTLAARRDALSA